MRHSFKTGVGSEKMGSSTEHALQLDLDLEIENLLPTDNVALRLVSIESDLRRMLFSLVANDVCNHACEGVSNKLGLSTYKTDVQVDGDVHVSTESQILIPSGATKLTMKNLISVSMTVTSPVELHIPQALYAMRSKVGEKVSHIVVGVLKNRFLHIEDQLPLADIVEHCGRLTMKGFSQTESTAKWN